MPSLLPVLKSDVFGMPIWLAAAVTASYNDEGFAKAMEAFILI